MSGIVMMERSLAPQWKAIAVIVVSMFACLLMGIAVVQSMDTAVYDSLPPAMLALAGIPAGRPSPPWCTRRCLASWELSPLRGSPSLWGLG